MRPKTSRKFVAMKANYTILRIDKKKCFCVVQGLKPEQRGLFARRGVRPVDSHRAVSTQGEGLFIRQKQIPLTRLIAVYPDISLVKGHGDVVNIYITYICKYASLDLIAENELFLGKEEVQGTPGVEKSGKGVCIRGEILSIDGRLRYAYPNEDLMRRRSSPHLAPYD